jgi:hypothetical protein
VRRWALVIAFLLIAGFAVAAGIAATTGGSKPKATPTPGLTAAELTAYTEAVLPALSDGGKTIEQGMKPALAALSGSDKNVPPAAVAGEAQAWVRDLRDVRGRVAAVPAPAALREAARLFDTALGQYVAAAETFGLAAAATGRERTQLVDQGVATARAGDATYDDASRIIQDLRRRLGLGPTADFPDPSASPSG